VDWEKPSPELIRILEEAADPFEVVERRKMFGCPPTTSRNMFAGVYGLQLFLRLATEREGGNCRKAWVRRPSSHGRPADEGVLIPAGSRLERPGSAGRVDAPLRGVHVSLPPKEPKPRKTGGAGGAASAAPPAPLQDRPRGR